MRFAEPVWLWMGLGVSAALIVLMCWSVRQRARALVALTGPKRSALGVASLSPARQRLKQAALLLGTASVFVALARPQWGYHLEAQHGRGIDLMFAIDTSKSMRADDLRPSRLARAKLAVEDLVSQLEGDRV